MRYYVHDVLSCAPLLRPAHLFGSLPYSIVLLWLFSRAVHCVFVCLLRFDSS